MAKPAAPVGSIQSHCLCPMLLLLLLTTTMTKSQLLLWLLLLLLWCADGIIGAGIEDNRGRRKGLVGCLAGSLALISACCCLALPSFLRSKVILLIVSEKITPRARGPVRPVGRKLIPLSRVSAEPANYNFPSSCASKRSSRERREGGREREGCSGSFNCCSESNV